MEKKMKNQISLICFIIGFILILKQDFSKLRTIEVGFVWPWAIMFYSGLLLILIGYLLRG
jgi:hypothetical protein